MDDLERAQKTRDAIYWGMYAIKRQGRAEPLGLQVGPEALEAAFRMHELWKREVNILEAAEKQAQADDEPKANNVLMRLMVLEKVFEKHEHMTSTDRTGPPVQGHEHMTSQP